MTAAIKHRGDGESQVPPAPAPAPASFPDKTNWHLLCVPVFLSPTKKG
ncbi:hypothetical protein [Kamptonema formosum]|nr:hypothetical protein [Oscillatoria sp. PCC 10802]